MNHKFPALVKKKYRLPFCASCMWRCGLTQEEIAAEIGYVTPQVGGRVVYGREWFPVRKRGGDHTYTHTEAGCATSCGQIPDFEGTRYHPQQEFDRQMIIVASVDRAFKTMQRRPLPLWRLERIERDFKKNLAL